METTSETSSRCDNKTGARQSGPKSTAFSPVLNAQVEEPVGKYAPENSPPNRHRSLFSPPS